MIMHETTPPCVVPLLQLDKRGQSDPLYRCQHVVLITHSLVKGEGEFFARSSFLK